MVYVQRVCRKTLWRLKCYKTIRTYVIYGDTDNLSPQPNNSGLVKITNKAQSNFQ